jgi:transposase
MQCEEDWAVMHALYQGHGWSIARIAREFDVTWRTARRYATAETVPRYRPRARPAELTKAQAAHVTRRLGAHPELRATTLYREVRELGYGGSYPSFARRVRVLRPIDRQADPEVRFETDPGVQVQADWADCGQWLVGEELCSLHALVAVLGFSRMVAVRFATDTTRPTTLVLLTECLVDLQRARIVTLSWDGAQVGQIAAQLGCHPRTVYRWLHRFNQGGVDDLGDLPRSGRPRRLSELERGRVIALVGSDPPGRLVRQPDGSLAAADEQQPAQWTLDALAAAAQAEGIAVGRSQVRRILQAEGCAGARCAPGAEAATHSSPQKSGDHRPLHHPAAGDDRDLRRRARPGHSLHLPTPAGLDAGWPPRQGTLGLRPRPGADLGIWGAAGV